MGTTHPFTRREVLRILEVTDHQLDYWERLRLVCPRKCSGKRFYDFRDLISLRTAKQLVDEGVPAQRLRRSIVALKQQLAEVRAPLTELRIMSNGRDIVVERDGTRVEPLSGQLVLNFGTRDLGDRVRVMPERSAEDWFALALEFESDETTQAEAIDAYQHALGKRPDWVEALVNLGALLYEQANFEAAADCFRRAANLQPESHLARYNLGNALEEIGRLEAAREQLREAVHLKADYADAHYNLALVCEKLAAYDEARRHWRRYLELDPSSPWCDYARQRLAHTATAHRPAGSAFSVTKKP